MIPTLTVIFETQTSFADNASEISSEEGYGSSQCEPRARFRFARSEICREGSGVVVDRRMENMAGVWMVVPGRSATMRYVTGQDLAVAVLAMLALKAEK